MRNIVLLWFMLASSVLGALPALSAETRAVQPGVPPPKASIAELAWIAGEWNGEGLGGLTHEIYSPAESGQIVGHFRLSKAGKIQFYEIVTFAETGGSLECRLKHFNADLTGWKEKNEVQTFPLVAVEQDAWYFDGMTIRREAADKMRVVVRVEAKDGTTPEIAFSYQRAK